MRCPPYRTPCYSRQPGNLLFPILQCLIGELHHIHEVVGRGSGFAIPYGHGSSLSAICAISQYRTVAKTGKFWFCMHWSALGWKGKPLFMTLNHVKNATVCTVVICRIRRTSWEISLSRIQEYFSCGFHWDQTGVNLLQDVHPSWKFWSRWWCFIRTCILSVQQRRCGTKRVDSFVLFQHVWHLPMVDVAGIGLVS